MEMDALPTNFDEKPVSDPAADQEKKPKRLVSASQLIGMQAVAHHLKKEAVPSAKQMYENQKAKAAKQEQEQRNRPSFAPKMTPFTTR